jgi:acetyl esterase/lipase
VVYAHDGGVVLGSLDLYRGLISWYAGQTLDPDRVPYLTRTYDNNYTTWSAVLGDPLGTDSVSPVAARARLANYAGLPPAYIDVGDLDIFRGEAIAYAQNLAHVGIRRAMADRAHAIPHSDPSTRTRTRICILGG